jgi:hypothetical protein
MKLFNLSPAAARLRSLLLLTNVFVLIAPSQLNVAYGNFPFAETNNPPSNLPPSSNYCNDKQLFIYAV